MSNLYVVPVSRRSQVCCHDNKALLVLAFFVMVSLHGCESEYEKALRLSCGWNTDIALVGCDRFPYARCIENCEYCLGKKGTANEGKSDECAQLKCGAYCAKAVGSRCADTYRVLCGNGVQELANAGQTCNADCNSARGKGCCVVCILSLVLLTPLDWADALCFKSRSVVLLIATLLFVMSLQGCNKDKICPGSQPSISDWQVDVAALDRAAGCHDEWDIFKGNKCASDLPVMWAKKGVHGDIDDKWVKEQVENENYQCISYASSATGQPRYCTQWTAAESSCDEEDFGICTCRTSSTNGQYCASWTCLMKEAEQHLCWKSSCGDNGEPCVECGQHGSSPFPMNQQVYNSLLQAEGIAAIASVGLQDSVNQLRSKHYDSYSWHNQCYTNRDIKSVHETTCQTWREIETELSYCFCTQPDSTGAFCEQWQCEEKDVGQFSILFAKAMSYQGLVEGSEIEVYKCLQTVDITNGGKRCGRWKGDINSYEEVETTQCVQCNGNDLSYGSGATNCNSWVCNEYELPRIHDKDQWGKRLGFSVLHFLWICPLMSPLCLNSKGVLLRPSSSDETVPCPVYFVGMLVLTVFLNWLIWAIGFLRYQQKEGRWWHPRDPFLGLFLPSVAGWSVAVVISLFMEKGRVCAPGIIQVPILLFCGWLHTNGLILVGPVFGIAGIGACLVGMGMYWRQNNKVDVDNCIN